LQYRLSRDNGDEEQGGLLANADGAEDTTTSEALSARFRAFCDAELQKIETFYRKKEGELFEQLDSIRDDVAQVDEEGAFGDVVEDSDEESGDSGDEDGGFIKKSSKLLKSVVGSSSKRRTSESDPSGTLRRQSSSFARQHGRKRSGTGSDDSSTDVLVREASRDQDELPPETTAEIDSQIQSTMQAAAPDESQQSQNSSGLAPLPTPSTSRQAGPPLVSPNPFNNRRKSRALSFGGSSANDIWSSNSRRAVDMRITFKLRIQALFRDLSQLKEYISLNQSKSALYGDAHSRLNTSLQLGSERS
jgi:phosphate transporter